MEIPWQELDTETLDRLLSEIVTRDGTDYGFHEKSTEAKIASARKALISGSSILLWDAETETAVLKTVDQVREEAERFRVLQKQSGITNQDK